MTADRWRDELVRLAMEAYDDIGNVRPGEYSREAMERRLRERMAQAAQAIHEETAAAEADLALVVEVAERLGNRVDDLPEWLSEAGVNVPSTALLDDAIEAARKRSRERERARRPAPKTLQEVVRQLVEDQGEQYGEHISVDDHDGTSSFVTDGRSALLTVERIGSNAPPRMLTDRQKSDALAMADGPAHEITLEALERWRAAAVTGLADVRCGLVGANAYDVDRVMAWAGQAARVAPGPMTLRQSSDGNTIRIDGAGWVAVVMGLRVGAEGMPRLLTVTP